MFHKKPKKPACKTATSPRGPRGEGSVFPDKRRGGYRGKVPIGRYANGKTRYKEVWGATQAECVAAKKLVQPPGPEVTVGEWAARWLASLTVRSSTKAGYARQITRRIIPSLGAIRLAELTVSRVKTALGEWAKAGTATANRTLRVGATMFSAAILDELVTTNPFARCARLKYEAKPLDPFTLTELLRIVESYTVLAAAPIFAFLAATGARVGEACALDIADYDPATGRVQITKTWDVRHGVRPPKSRHSRRTLTVPVVARPAIEHAIGSRPKGPIFATRFGRRYDPGELGKVFNALLSHLKIRRRNIHQMRHGVISGALGTGVKLANVARDVGDTVATLVRVYVHAGEGDGLTEAMDRLFTVAGTVVHSEPKPIPAA